MCLAVCGFISFLDSKATLTHWQWVGLELTGQNWRLFWNVLPWNWAHTVHLPRQEGQGRNHPGLWNIPWVIFLSFSSHICFWKLNCHIWLLKNIKVSIFMPERSDEASGMQRRRVGCAEPPGSPTNLIFHRWIKHKSSNIWWFQPTLIFTFYWLIPTCSPALASL